MLKKEVQRLGTHKDLIVRQKWEEFVADFYAGKVDDKKPDFVEYIPDDNAVIITDITLRYADPVHNFKTLFYREIFKELTNAEVTAMDFKQLSGMQVTEIP